MNENGKKMLSLMFRKGERICCSPDKFGYHSIPLENAMSESITLVSPNENIPIVTMPSDSIVLVALNPMKKGFRTDENCSGYRNFLVEIDGISTMDAQIDYIKRLGLPYSAMVWSGSKSLHTLISLDTDLPSEKTWRMFAQWILSIAGLADQQTKNPSRSIRIPGNIRRETGNEQKLVEFKGPVKLIQLVDFLKKHMEAQPKEPEKRTVHPNANFNGIRKWCLDLLEEGLKADRGRNNQWYAIAYEFALSGYTEDETIQILGNYFTSERGFKEREWLVTIKSAFKHAYEEM
jgi:hypothetical protein